MQFNYYSDREVLMPPVRRQVANRWIRRVFEEMNCQVGEINFQFTDDAGILQANQKYLGHDYYTDVITFPSEGGEYGPDAVYGDILISVDTVATNARELNVPIDQELYRVMIHGVLHLLGIDDQTPEQREVMHMAEERALYQLHEMMSGKPSLRYEISRPFFQYLDEVYSRDSRI